MIKKQYIKVALCILAFTLFASACGSAGASRSQKVAKLLKRDTKSFSNLAIGELNIHDEAHYYKVYVEQITAEIADPEASNIPEEQQANAKIAVEVFQFLADNLNDNTDTGTYLGTKNADKTISGIYIYEWKNKVKLALEPEQLNAANNYVLSGGHGDLLFVKDDCLIAVLSDFFVKNNVTLDDLNKVLGVKA